MRKFFILLGLLCVALIVALPFLSKMEWSRKYVIEHRVYFEKLDRMVRHAIGVPMRGTPDLERFEERLEQADLKLGSPIFMRIFKAEHELEIWMKRGDVFHHFATYPICKWSGRVGPKLKEGDRQAPEGFYTVAKGQLNPKSRWFRSFNLGFPNLLDKAHGRTGSFLMVHGGCGSIGCYAMTNPQIKEIWEIVTKAFEGGQGRFHVHAYPFRMTDWNMRLHSANRWSPFWRDLKKGYDLFEKTRVPPLVGVCEKRYQVSARTSGAKEAGKILKKCEPKTARSN